MNFKSLQGYGQGITCPYSYKQQAVTTIELIAAATATTSQTLTLPTGQGDAKQIGITIGSSTVADLALLNFTINADSVDVAKNQNSLRWSPLYQNSGQFLNCIIPEGSTVTVTAINGSASIIRMFFDLYFVPNIAFQMDWFSQMRDIFGNYPMVLQMNNVSSPNGVNSPQVVF